MPDRLAVKRLTASDLTFFEDIFRTMDNVRQKAINLNADCFVGELYPGLPDLVPQIGDEILVSLSILGPNGSPAHNVARKITKGDRYKNWRLNGEFVPDPDDEPDRYNTLKPGDLAVFDFQGDPTPQKLSLLLVEQAAEADIALHGVLNAMIPGGNRTMVPVSRQDLANAAASISKTHPIWQLAADSEFEAALEDAALGGEKGLEKLVKAPAKVVSAATLAAKRVAAEQNGRDGEALAWVYLTKQHAGGQLASIEWASQKNAVSPFDFQVVHHDGLNVRIDAKSTSGKFEWPIHMSMAELRAAAEGSRYDIYRLYGLNKDGASLKIARDIQEIVGGILDGLNLPDGVNVDGVSIDPGVLDWSEEETIDRPDEEDVEIEE
jgi:hypothetical protein